MKELTKRGFSLLEVLVAMAILELGILVFGRILSGFYHQRLLEKNQAKAFIEAVQGIEEFVQSPVSCRNPALTSIPGVVPVAWVIVSVDGIRPVMLRRLVPCVP